MSYVERNWNAADSSLPESDRALSKPWEPLADNDYDGGDHTVEVEPEI